MTSSTNIRRIITKPSNIRQAIHEKVLEAVRKKFPVAGRNFTAKLVNATVKFSELSHGKQSELLLSRHNATDGVYADIDIVENSSGRTVGRLINKRICNIPYYTNRYTLMLDGNEYAVVSQMRTKSGVYTRKRGNDEIESSFNLAKGANFNGKDVIVGLNNNGTVDKKSGVQNISGSTDNQTIAFNAHFDYDRTFDGVHNVSAMLVANGYQQTISGQYHKTSNANMGLQLSYNYDHKYYAGFSLATPWSAKLPSSNRLGFSPSATLGWRLSKEKFLENSFFDDLTLSASYTDLKTDLGIDNYYMYLGVYQNGGWWDWNGGSGHSAVQSKHGENNDFNYLHRKEFSVSLHAEVLDKSLSLDASYFLSKWTNGIIQARNQMPSYMFSYYPESSFIPYMNYNEDKRTGFDLGVNYKKQIGELGIGVGANLTYYTTKATKRDDSQYADAYQYRQGQPLDAIWGYECEGFFKDQADIDASPKQIIGGTIRPGDLKYKDQNGDNVIDGKDQVCLGKGGWYGTPTTLGVNVTLKYKNFTLFLLGTGNFGAKAVKNSTYYWVGGDAKYTAEMRGRWTPETAATATYPRLTTEAGTNNYQTSDFWMYSTDRFDLQKVQLSYDFPKSVFGKSFIRGLQLFVNGNSLLTIAKERKILEMNVNNKGAAPLNRLYSIGAKVSF